METSSTRVSEASNLSERRSSVDILGEFFTNPIRRSSLFSPFDKKEVNKDAEEKNDGVQHILIFSFHLFLFIVAKINMQWSLHQLK